MRVTVLVAFAWALCACKFPFPADVQEDGSVAPDATGGPRVGGTMSAMWQGGVASLRLVSGDVDETLTVDSRGVFTFASEVVAGDPYEVTVASEPDRHRCTVSRGSGTVPPAGATDVGVHCAVNLPLMMTTSLPFDWTFDPAVDDYDFETSLLVQGLTVRVDLAEAATIAVDGTPVTTGVSSPEVRLGPGVNDVPISVRVGSLSNTYRLRIDRGAVPVEQFAYGKASNAEAGDRLGDRFGFFGLGAASVAVDGNTLVVGAHGESSGPGQPAGDNSVAASGAVYVFVRDGARWQQVAMLKAPNAGGGDRFGGAVAVSGDFIAVGAAYEDSAATTINGDQTSNVAADAGAVYVYRRVGNSWLFDAYIKASNAQSGDHFGNAVALDGSTLVVGAPVEDGAANGNPADNSVTNAGAVYVFTRDGVGWSSQSRLKPAVVSENMYFGLTVDVEGDRIAVGADRAGGGGAAYVFRRVNTTWSLEAEVKAPNAQSGDMFGNTVGCGSIGTVLDGSNLDHLTSLRRGRSRGSGLGTSPSA